MDSILIVDDEPDAIELISSSHLKKCVRELKEGIRALHEAGVPIVAGTDEGVPGFSIYREMELYVMAGMAPMDAIRSATAVSASVGWRCLASSCEMAAASSMSTGT